MNSITAKAQAVVRASPLAVFNAFIDAETMSKFWFTRRDEGLRDMSRVRNILASILSRFSNSSISNANGSQARVADTSAQSGSRNSSVDPFEINSEPDSPQGFGRKTFWLAIKSSDPDEVANTLTLSGSTPANWETGMRIAYGHKVPPDYDGYVFISPSVDGWVFVLSAYFISIDIQINSDPDPKANSGFDLIFKTLYSKFTDVQLFGSHRVVSAILWARALDGKIVRKYYIADGTVLANYGELTEAERALNLLDIGGLSPGEAVDAIFEHMGRRNTLEDELIAAGKSRKEAELQLSQSFQVSPDGFDEDLHFSIAEIWSVSPENFEELEIENGVGILGKLPPAMLQ